MYTLYLMFACHNTKQKLYSAQSRGGVIVMANKF